jgi:hypothetical protein
VNLLCVRVLLFPDTVGSKAHCTRVSRIPDLNHNTVDFVQMHDLLPLRRPRQLAEYNEQGEKSMLTVTHDVLANYFNMCSSRGRCSIVASTTPRGNSFSVARS